MPTYRPRDTDPIHDNLSAILQRAAVEIVALPVTLTFISLDSPRAATEI